MTPAVISPETSSLVESLSTMAPASRDVLETAPASLRMENPENLGLEAVAED